MRILHVIPYFSIAHGGPVNVVANIARKMASDGHDVTIMATDVTMPGEKKDYIDVGPQVRVQIIPCLSNWAAYNLKLHISPKMKNAIARSINDYDIVHLHEWRGIPNLYALKCAKAAKVPFVVQPHGSSPMVIGPQNKMVSISKRMYDMVYGRGLVLGASRIIALSQNESKLLVKQGVPDQKIAVIPNGLDIKEISSLPERGSFREKYGIPRNQRIVLFLARFNPNKGADLLIRAFSNLNMPDVVLAMVGPDDGCLDDVKHLTHQLGVRAIFTGPLSGRDKWSAFVDCDVYVLPSVYETFPLTVLEAFACSRPCIVMESCGISDIVGGKGLVIKRDGIALSEALKKILDQPQVREEMGTRGRTLAINLTWDKIAPMYESLYAECISNTYDGS